MAHKTSGNINFMLIVLALHVDIVLMVNFQISHGHMGQGRLFAGGWALEEAGGLSAEPRCSACYSRSAGTFATGRGNVLRDDLKSLLAEHTNTTVLLCKGKQACSLSHCTGTAAGSVLSILWCSCLSFVSKATCWRLRGHALFLCCSPVVQVTVLKELLVNAASFF